MSDRLMSGDPRGDSWFVYLPEKLEPKQVMNILRASLAGDLWQLWSLSQLMMRSWPMLRKCSHELRGAVAQTKFQVHPYCEDGQEPSAKAKEKADLVKRAFASFRPQMGSDEKDFRGLIYDITDMVLLGVSVNEIVWHEVKGELLPRASAWVNPRHFVFTHDGKMTVQPIKKGKSFDVMRWNNSGKGEPVEIDDTKFLVAQYQSQSGSVLGCGLIPVVAWWWAAMVFNREWMLSYAQKFGTPFKFLTYRAGSTQEEIDQLEAYAQKADGASHLIAPEGTAATVTPPGRMGADNAHVNIRRQADEEVQMLFLGQTSTTTATPGKLGNDDSKMDVRREKIEEITSCVDAVLEGFARTIIRVNYGDEDDCPTVKADFSEPLKHMEAAQMVATLMGTGLPFNADDIYKLVGQKMPEAGDLVVKQGTLGTMQDPAAQLVQPTPEQQMEQQAAMQQAMQPQGEPGADGGDGEEPWTQARQNGNGNGHVLNGFIRAGGDFGHAGRPGHRGGSSPKGTAPHGPKEPQYQTGLKLKPTKRRAFEGESVELKTKISKQDAGALGERVVIAHLHSQGLHDARPLNIQQQNYAVDLVQDHGAIEVKTGLASNGKSAQQWRATIGQPGKDETERLAKMSPEKKKAWNQAKADAIMDRKKKAVDKLSKELKRPVKSWTMTTIINPDTRTVDLFKFDGFHHRIPWNSPEVKQAYVASYQY